MRDYNRELFKKTLDSYWQAVEQAFEISPFFDIDGSGCPHYDIIAGKIRATVPTAEIVQHATDVHVNSCVLMDYHGPKEIKPSFHIWRDSFVRVSLSAAFEWKCFTYKFPSHYEDGTYEPAGENVYVRTLRLAFPEINRGLGMWKTNYQELQELAEKCQPEVRDSFLGQLRHADKKAQEWLHAVNGRPQVELS